MAKFRALHAIAAASVLTAVGGTAIAAEPVASLARIDGTVLVNQGQQYITGKEGTALRPGDRIMAMSTGSAVIKFTDGCTYKLDDDEVLTIGETSTCKADKVAKKEIGPYYAALGTDVAPLGTAPASTPAIAAGVVGVLAAIDPGNDDDRQPQSP